MPVAPSLQTIYQGISIIILSDYGTPTNKPDIIELSNKL